MATESTDDTSRDDTESEDDTSRGASAPPAADSLRPIIKSSQTQARKSVDRANAQRMATARMTKRK
jgi:hypothetical protein